MQIGSTTNRATKNNHTMNKATRTTQKVRLINFLAKGKEATASELQTRLSIANPSAVVAELRKEGAPIYTNERRNSSGKTVFKYRLATR